MTENMHYIVDTVTTTINRKYGDTLPTLEQINNEAEIIRSAFSALYPITEEDFVQVKKTLATNILHTIGVAMTLRGRDSEHQSWYHVQENDGFYWERYKTYLKVVKHWGVDVVNRLNKTSSDVMNTKTSTLAVGLLALENKTIQVSYAEPEMYNIENYSLPGEQIVIYKLK